jgi:hypothetical protein
LKTPTFSFRAIGIAISLVCIAALTWFLASRYAPNEWLYLRKFRAGAKLISKIEEFKRDNGKYPPNLTALGIDEKETGPLYYSLRDDGSYSVWFSGGKSFFASQVYDSKTRNWHESD